MKGSMIDTELLTPGVKRHRLAIETDRPASGDYLFSAWRCNDPGDGPFHRQTNLDRTSLETGSSGPSSNTIGDAVVSDLAWKGTVATLFCRKSPPNISRLVVPIVIDPVERVLARWSPTHIREKRTVGFNPHSAYGDPASSISMELRISRIQTAPKHMAPGTVFFGPLANTVIAMNYRSSYHDRDYTLRRGGT
jgi:hypothetical protein